MIDQKKYKKFKREYTRFVNGPVLPIFIGSCLLVLVSILFNLFGF